jgi:hypothetical protein
MKLADALLRRKELQQKVDQVRAVKGSDVFEVKMQRRQITDTVDDIQAQVPKLDLKQVTKEYDYYSNKLRLIDAAIQQLNWTTDITVDPLVWKDYDEDK